ncbi:hypothetical protein [Micrococcus lacusdianchii]|uniref:hypothetical protein n=1 Tax=Micrococcus lacusdianchii TaxID=2915940 RepID=UPI0020034E7C|nr:hypothetical protein [Micrococcus sp. JXJ CY 30]
MPTGSDRAPRPPRRAGEDGSASVEFLTLSVILLVPLVYLMVFASQIQAAAFGAVAAADQAARVMVSADGGRPGPAEGAIRLTLGDYGVAADAYRASLACDLGGCGSLEPGEVVEVRVAVELAPPLVPGSWLPQGLVTVDSSARARMPRY